jgi:ribonuclease P protein subunit POP4
MKTTPELICQEFIGTEIEVSESNNSGYIGFSGKIIDETRNSFVILREGKRKRILKESGVFHFKFPDGTIIEIDGKILAGRPEDRLKKRIKRLW